MQIQRLIYLLSSHEGIEQEESMIWEGFEICGLFVVADWEDGGQEAL